jgi:hypothetical protein
MGLVKQANDILNKALLEMDNSEDLTIEDVFKDLDDEIIFNIVNYWYNFKTADIFQNESGLDLEEYIERKMDDTI